MIIRSLVTVLGLGVLACSAYDQPCSCGGKFTDPFTRATVSSSIPPVRADHCECRCGGTGEVLLMTPFQRSCADFEVECTTTNGREARYVCR